MNLKLHYKQNVVSLVHDQSNFTRGGILLTVNELNRISKLEALTKPNQNKNPTRSRMNNNLNMLKNE